MNVCLTALDPDHAAMHFDNGARLPQPIPSTGMLPIFTSASRRCPRSKMSAIFSEGIGSPQVLHDHRGVMLVGRIGENRRRPGSASSETNTWPALSSRLLIAMVRRAMSTSAKGNRSMAWSMSQLTDAFLRLFDKTLGTVAHQHRQRIHLKFEIVAFHHDGRWHRRLACRAPNWRRGRAPP